MHLFADDISSPFLYLMFFLCNIHKYFRNSDALAQRPYKVSIDRALSSRIQNQSKNIQISGGVIHSLRQTIKLAC